MTASQPTLLKIMVPPIARPGRVHICQQTLFEPLEGSNSPTIKRQEPPSVKTDTNANVTTAPIGADREQKSNSARKEFMTELKKFDFELKEPSTPNPNNLETMIQLAEKISQHWQQHTLAAKAKIKEIKANDEDEPTTRNKKDNSPD